VCGLIQFRVNSRKSNTSLDAYRLELYSKTNHNFEKMLFKKQEIYSIDFTGTEHLNTEGWETWADQVSLSHLHTWLLPQLVAWYGNWTLVYSEGEIDCLATIKHNCPDPKSKAFYALSRIKRSFLVAQQTKSPEYATLTPLILMGQKRMKGINYETWKKAKDLQWILEPRLLEAVMLDDQDLSICASLGSERLLEIQTQGLTTKSGKTAGTQKPAKSTWSLTGIQDTEIGHLPKITQTILAQCWLAHPELRTPYMILDPQDWDAMPQPLVSNNIFKAEPITQQPKKQVKETAGLMPWDL
jgi:hypothetical protein